MYVSADNCTDYELQFERVFSVPGDVAMLNSTLVTSSVFNYPADPYNITWYHSTTGQEIRSESGRILVRGETLWFLNVTLEDSGEYVCVLRYGSIVNWWLKVSLFAQLDKKTCTKTKFEKCGWTSALCLILSWPELPLGATNRPPSCLWISLTQENVKGRRKLTSRSWMESLANWPVRWRTILISWTATTSLPPLSGTEWVTAKSCYCQKKKKRINPCRGLDVVK